MKIIIATHHFPPTYVAGVEQITLRESRELQARGHDVEVVCIEAIDRGTLTPSATHDTYLGIPVHRLTLDLFSAPDPFRWNFRNPEIAAWFADFLREARPDVIHVTSPYLLSAAVPLVATQMGIPTVLTLFDFWYLCPLMTLLRPDGHVCAEPVPAGRCVWCQLSVKRRFRAPDQVLDGRLGDLFTSAAGVPALAAGMGIEPDLAAMEERRAYVKKVLESVDVVIHNSEFVKEKLLSYGFRPRRLEHLPFGFETDLSPEPREEDQRRLRIGYLGQVAHHKGVHVLVEAFDRLSYQPGACELVVHGKATASENYEQELAAMAQGHGNIRLAGPYPHAELDRILAELDVVVVPSLWYENRPSVISEAFAHGLPVIASDLGSMPELVQHEVNGLLFRAGDARDLARQLQRLLDEPGLLARLRAGVRPPFALQDEIDRLEQIFAGLAPTAYTIPRASSRVGPGLIVAQAHDNESQIISQR
jgi:glycosyltransferase involved in cell wall biosynthesis